MKHTYLLAIIAAAVILGGCSGKKDASAGYTPVVEKIDQAGTGAENPEAAQAAPGTEAESAEAENADAESAEAEGADAAQQAPADGTAAEGGSDTDDYAAQIRSEIAGIAESSASCAPDREPGFTDTNIDVPLRLRSFPHWRFSAQSMPLVIPMQSASVS